MAGLLAVLGRFSQFSGFILRVKEAHSLLLTPALLTPTLRTVIGNEHLLRYGQGGERYTAGYMGGRRIYHRVYREGIPGGVS